MTDNPPDNKIPILKWYGTIEVSEIFGVQPATIRHWIHTRKLKAVRIGNRLKIEREELIRFANERYVD